MSATVAVMRTLILIALLGCSSKSTAPAPKTEPTAAAPTVAITPPPTPPSPPVASTPVPPPTDGAKPGEAVEPPREEPVDHPCQPRMESWAAGLHDRYVFHDEKTELSGYKNKAGTVVIKPRFREAYPFGPGGIAAVNDQKVGFGFIDPSGKMIAIAHAMDNGPDYFQDKLARIIGKTKKVGFIDDTGRIVIPPKFDDAMPFCSGTAQVELGGKQLTIDKTGNVVAPKAP